jgi:predicted metal-dependent hydrolase
MNIVITRKRMKSMRMTVEPTGTVKVSAPKRVSDKQIQDFIHSKHEWILKAQDFYTKKHAEIAVGEGKVLLHGIGYVISNE